MLSQAQYPTRNVLGFTLLELILAIAAFSLVTVGSFAAINSLVQAREAQQQTAELLQQLQLTNHHLERDIVQLVNRGARTQGLNREPAVLGQQGLLRGTRTGWSNPLNQQRSNLQRFQYRIDDQRLLREHWVHVDNSGGVPAVSTVLLEGINNLSFRYQNNAREWLDEWQPGAAAIGNLGELPRAIEVTLELEDESRIRRVFVTLQGSNG